MTSLGEIILDSFISPYAAAEKIRAAALELGVAGSAVARLIALTTELCRDFSLAQAPGNIAVAIDEGGDPAELVLVFRGVAETGPGTLAVAHQLCDKVRVSGSGGTYCVEVREPIPASTLPLDPAATGRARECVRRETVVEELHNTLVESHGQIRNHVERLEKSEKELAESRNALRAMAADLALTEARERKFLAAALHDSVVQSLAATTVKARVLEEMLVAPEAQELLAAIRRELGYELQELRSLVFELSPPVLYELGLGAAIEAQGDTLCEHGIKLIFRNRQKPESIDEVAKVIAFQCVRELLANVRKHARADEVVVSQVVNDNKVIVTIADNGTGFDVERVLRSGHRDGHFGLMSIRERLRQVGGSIEISSSRKSGTRAVVTVPLTVPEQSKQAEDEA